MTIESTALLRRHEAMKASRTGLVEQVWRDSFDLTFPLRGSGLGGTSLSPASGAGKQADLLDSTAADSCTVLAANIMAGLTPANALWFAMGVGNETDEENRWLEDAAKLLWENIHASNFDAEGYESCLDMVCAGQFALFIDEDRERGGLAFHQWPLAQVYVASTRADGRPDVVHREYELTAEAAASEFGLDALPEAIRKAATEKPDDKFTFVQMIHPRTPFAVGAKLAKNLPIASLHVALASKQVVRESGFHEMPVIVPRWMRVPGSVYAVGPMYPALPDCRTLNDFKALDYANADIAVSGMWLGIDDGVFNPRTVKLGARKIIIAADKDSLTPLQSGSDFSLSDTKIRQLQASIRKVLMADQLQPQDGPQMTATEVHVRVEMIRKLLGPIYGRLQAEYLKPMVERCFGLAYRAGVFKPPPQSLAGRVYGVTYISPMARAQKSDDVIAIEAVFASAVAMAELDPEIIDNLDTQEALKLIVEGRGAPQSIRRSVDDVAKIREARAQQQKAQQVEQGAMAAQQAGMEAGAKRAAGA